MNHRTSTSNRVMCSMSGVSPSRVGYPDSRKRSRHPKAILMLVQEFTRYAVILYLTLRQVEIQKSHHGTFD